MAVSGELASDDTESDPESEAESNQEFPLSLPPVLIRLAPTASHLAYLPSPHSYVHLQHLSLPPAHPPRLHGAVLVRNVAFAKSVSIRFTINSWETVSETVASYSLGLPPGIANGSFDTSWDKFTFTIKLDDVQHSLQDCSLLFAVRYIAHGAGEWWDNNHNQNYCVKFECLDSNGPHPELYSFRLGATENQLSSWRFSSFLGELNGAPPPDSATTKPRPYSTSVIHSLAESLNACLEIMERELRFNISGREVSDVSDMDVPGLFDTVNRTISTRLLHACCFWGYYVEHTAPSETLLSAIDDFLSIHLLHWMEVLNLKHCMYEGELTLSRVEKWLRVS